MCNLLCSTIYISQKKKHVYIFWVTETVWQKMRLTLYNLIINQQQKNTLQNKSCKTPGNIANCALPFAHFVSYFLYNQNIIENVSVILNSDITITMVFFFISKTVFLKTWNNLYKKKKKKIVSWTHKKVCTYDKVFLVSKSQSTLSKTLSETRVRIYCYLTRT